jgi:hypothetical protein
MQFTNGRESMELEITWNRVVRVWWSYLWRNLLAIVASLAVGGVFGALMGFALGFAGISPDSIQKLAMPVGMLIGLAISVVPVKMILGKDFGEFKLVLVESKRNR